MESEPTLDSSNSEHVLCFNLHFSNHHHDKKNPENQTGFFKIQFNYSSSLASIKP